MVVYGIAPQAIESVPGESTSTFAVANSAFKSLSLPQPDGNYFLRNDRILGMLLIDPDERFLAVSDVVEAEHRRDLEMQQNIEALIQKSCNDESEINTELRRYQNVLGNESSNSLLKAQVDDFSLGKYFDATETPLKHKSTEKEFSFELPERFSRASAYKS